MHDGLSDEDRVFLRALAQELVHAVANEIRPRVGAQGEDRRSFLSVQEAAQLLGVATKTIHALIRQGKLPSYRVGRLIRIQRDDLRSCLTADTEEVIDIGARCEEILDQSTRRRSGAC